MAAKRRAGSQLTQDNWEEEEEVVEDASFRVADNAVLAKRKIKKATRRIGASATGGTNKPSPFGAFKGFSSGSSASTADKQTFGSGFQVSSSKPGFGSAFQVSSSKPQKSTAPTLNFGAKSSNLPSSTAPSLAMGTNKSDNKKPALNGGTNTSNDSSCNSEYASKLTALNQGVTAWIQLHVAKTPVCDLTPVFRDYDKHLAEIERIYGSGSTTSASGNSSSTAFRSGSIKFGSQAMTQSSVLEDSEATLEATLVPSGGFRSGGQSASQSSTQKDPVGTQKTALGISGGFSFGGQAVSQSKSEEKKKSGLFGLGSGKITFGSTGTTFGSSASTGTGGSAGFSFPGGAGEQKKTEAKEKTTADEDEPPKPEVKVVEEKDALFSIRCKLYYKKDGQFKERGVGQLHLKRPGSSGQLLLRADTTLGNIIFNIGVPKALPAQRQGKNNVMLMAAMNPPPDKACPQCKKKYIDPQTSNACEGGCTPQATPILLRVKTGADADKLLEEINKLKE